MLWCRLPSDAKVLDVTAARDALLTLVSLPETVGVRLLRTDRDTTGIGSAEKKMRGGVEGDFDYLLVVEALSREGAQAAREPLAGVLAGALPGAQVRDAQVFQMIYAEAPYEGETP